jgi:hypothetical protein
MIIAQIIGHLVFDPIMDRLERRWPSSRKWVPLGLLVFVLLIFPAAVVTIISLRRSAGQ